MKSKELELIMDFPRTSHEIMNKVMRGFQSSEKEMHLTHTQTRTLFIIYDRKKMSMTELHCVVGLEKGSLTTVIDQLIKKELVVRNGDPEDRRKVNISLTEAGWQKVNILRMEMASYIKKNLEKLPARDHEQFYKTVTTLININRKL
jgi:DNA-binding MarR family transcriptional regulator